MCRILELPSTHNIGLYEKQSRVCGPFGGREDRKLGKALQSMRRGDPPREIAPEKRALRAISLIARPAESEASVL